MTLRGLLDDSARFDAEYGPSLSNHLPMALVALHRLGAGDDRLAAFAATYGARLHAMPPAEPWPAGDPWQGAFGDPRAWPAYRNLFDEWMNHDGAPEVLSLVLPALWRGCGAAAFHGLIRTAYAVAAGHSHELADALAYWACRWFTVGAAAGPGTLDEPAALVGRLPLVLPRTGLIAERMALAAAHPQFASWAARLRVDAERTLPALACFAAHQYAQTRDFTVLHLVTSAHAVRVLLPWLDEEQRLDALRHYATAYLAGTLAAGAVTATAAGAPLPWPEIVARARACNDDHAIKLVDSCREQEAAYGAGPWQAAASSAVASLPPS
jgi:hypothetical protein